MVNNIYQKIDTLNEFKFDFSLSRVKKALKACGNPQDSFAVIHVAGSNGKGSVTAYLANILTAHGFKTGMYTSPHLKDIKERIVIDGKKVKENVFLPETSKLFSLLKKSKIWLTYFEFMTVLAFNIFRREKACAAVIEAGLGGRFDATNVDYKQKLLSIITSISLEHTDILGKTELAILKEKEEIIGKGDAVVNICRRELKDHVRARFGDKAEFAEESAPVLGVKVTKTGLEAEFKTGIFKTPMIEVVQAENISTVLTALKVIEKSAAFGQRGSAVPTTVPKHGGFKEGFVFDYAKVRKAIAKTSLPGRMSWNKKGYYLSVAHNPAAFYQALKALNTIYKGRKITIVFSVLKDKDVDALFKVATAFKNVQFVLTAINNPRAISVGKLKETVVKYGIKHWVEEENKAALKLARKHGRGGVVVVGGSFYLVNKFI